MPSVLIALGILLLAGAYLARRVRKVGTKEVKDEVDPDQPRDVEKSRAGSEAYANGAKHGPLSAADAEAAADLVAFVEKIGTTELRVVTKVRRRHGCRKPSRKQRQALRRRTLHGFATDPLAAAIPGRHRRAEPVEHISMALAWFTTPALEAAGFPELPVEPAPLPPLDFTGEFRRSDLFALLAADAEAGAQR